ncbi:MAG: hypothetical protein M1158_01685 [Candidatus Marsarchaeota archaeon]|nr:hypothetical protein [Candidatus Marsarchaeota archaeon]
MKDSYSSIVEYVLVGGTIAALALGAITLDIALIACASIAAMASLLVLKLWPVIESLVIKRTNMIQLLGEFELSGDRESATAIIDSGYSATGAAKVIGAPEAELGRERLEAIVARTGAPFRFVVQVEKFDPKGFVEKMETRRRMREIELSKVTERNSGMGLVKTRRLKNEISMIEHELEAIGAGLPLRLSAYVATSAAMPTKRAAEDSARAQIRALAAELGALGVECSVVTGNELIRLLRFDAVVDS